MPIYELLLRPEQTLSALVAIRAAGGTLVPSPRLDPRDPAAQLTEAELLADAGRHRQHTHLVFAIDAPLAGDGFDLGGTRVLPTLVPLPPETPESYTVGAYPYTRLPVRVYGPDYEEVALDENGSRPVLRVSYDSNSANVGVDLNELLDFVLTHRPDLLEARRAALAAKTTAAPQMEARPSPKRARP